MSARPTWKGFLKLSLVLLPVKAYTATASADGIRLNQLHDECHSRIQHKKTCPIHGEVPNDQIVSGFEYAKGQYVVIDPGELDKLRTEDDKAIGIETFVPAGTLDEIYASGRAYYLAPDGPVAQKPYALLYKSMVEQDRHAIAQVVLHGKEQLVLLRPLGRLIAMIVLHHDGEVAKPAAFEDEAPQVELSAEEQKLTKMLVDASTAKKFDFAKYKDAYTEKLIELINAKVAGKEIVAPPVHEQAQIINLMDALRQSVEQAQKPAAGEAAGKPPKKMAPSVRKREWARGKQSG